MLLMVTAARAGTVCPDGCVWPNIEEALASGESLLELQAGVHEAGVVIDRPVEIVAASGATVYAENEGDAVFSVVAGGSGSVLRDLVYAVDRQGRDGPLVSVTDAEVTVTDAQINGGYGQSGTPGFEVDGGTLILEHPDIVYAATTGDGIIRAVDAILVVRSGFFGSGFAGSAGGILARDSEVTVEGTTFSDAGESSALDGRTIRISGGSLVLDDVTVSSTSLFAETAEILVEGSTALTVRASTIVGPGPIGGGSGLRAADVALVDLDGARFVGWPGGAVSAEGVGSLVVRSSLFEDNAAQGGAGLVASADDLVIDGSWFCGNGGLAPDRAGGALRVAQCEGDCRVKRSVFQLNGAGDGGAIHTAVALAIEHATFRGNRADRGAALFAAGPAPTVEQSLVVEHAGGAALDSRLPDVFRTNALGNNVPVDATFPIGGDNLLGATVEFEGEPGLCGPGVVPTHGDDGGWVWDHGVGAITDEDRDGFLWGDDCDDLDPAAFPGAEEQPGDGIDQDCDGLELCPVDADGDGVGGDDTEPGPIPCGFPSGDCDDAAPEVGPGAEDVPGDGIDQDCDGSDATGPDPGPPESCDGPCARRIGGGCATAPAAGWLGWLGVSLLLRRRR